MPKTKLQDLMFTAIMVVVMVYCMTLYNMARESAFSYALFLRALCGMWGEVIAAFIAQRYVAGPIVKKLTARLLKPDSTPVLRPVVTAGCTAALMAPMMTLVVTILHDGLSTQLPLLWLPRLAANFPFALCIQIFYVGPLVRLIFRTLFKKQLAVSATHQGKSEAASSF